MENENIQNQENQPEQLEVVDPKPVGEFDQVMANHDRTLESFIAYCKAHPEDRFWQALRNWAEQDFVLFGNVPNKKGLTSTVELDGIKVYVEDTFNFAGRNQ